MRLPTRKEHTLEVYKDVCPYASYKPVTGTAREVLSRRISIDSLADSQIDKLVEKEMQGISRKHNRRRAVLSEGVVSSPSEELGDFLVVVEYDFQANVPWIEIPGEPWGSIINTRYKNGEISVFLLRPNQRISIIPESLRDVKHEYLRMTYIWPGDFKPMHIGNVPV